jgi:hypothetical protein
MANGNPEFNLSQCERFFVPLAATIQRFAARRNLALNRYSHESPSWDLSFEHPAGGFGRLSLAKSPTDTLEISAVVWIDDYDSFTRRLRKLVPKEVANDEASLTARLDSTIDEVLAWPLDERFVVHGGFERSWGSMSKSAFIASQPAFPKPALEAGS